MSQLQRAFEIIDILEEESLTLKQISYKLKDKYWTTRKTVIKLLKLKKIIKDSDGYYKVKRDKTIQY